MVNSALMPPPEMPADPEVALALGYAPVETRARLWALWLLDARLAAILRTTDTPMVGQLRLTWWHDAVGRAGEVGGEPVLAAVAEAGFPAVGLQQIVEGWEALLDDPADDTLIVYAEGRGGGLFTLAAAVLDTVQPIADAGAGWALVDLARHHSSPAVAARALALAGVRLAQAPTRWERAARPLGALTKLARRDLNGLQTQGSPRRVLAAGWLALAGR